ncbi:MAG: hypothetical protein PF692_14455 [Kiritimatiellae bacterium]|jgi:hypothetical protein|nr:hypothetical protein [Kiritimatiellia bacterium]
MRRNIFWCWIHFVIFGLVVFVTSMIWPKCLSKLQMSGAEIANIDLYNKLYPIFHWLQENIMAVFLFLLLFSLDLLLCSFLKTFKAKVVWTSLLTVFFMIVAIVASIAFNSSLVG